MKPRIPHTLLTLALLSTFTTFYVAQPSTAFAQGTAFTYQGRLNSSGSSATGIYDLRFTLYDAGVNGNTVGAPVTNSATGVTNGLFTVTLDFGSGVFTGPTNRWLEIAARTNGAASFTTLAPRQQILPTPYAIMANTASNLLGTLSVGQLGAGTANISISGNAATVANGVYTTGTYPNPAWITSLAGSKITGNIPGNAAGFTGSLVGDVTGTQGATVVGTVGGVSAANVASGANAANAATSANTAGTIVKRDASGNFSAGNITNNNLYLPATTASAGIIYSGGSPFIDAYGYQNFFAGSGAGNLALTGWQNTGIGGLALCHDTTGDQNTAIGGQALYTNTIGSFNTAIGYQALYSNTNSQNTAIGFQALYSNTSGYNNTANGFLSLYSNTSGYNNTANGFMALWANTSGTNNTANGYEALFSNTSGWNNTANGWEALFSNTNGFENTGIGYQALFSNASGYQNTGIGYQALFSNTTGIQNTANGFDALYSNTNGCQNTANGFMALFYNTSGWNNMANGFLALYANTSGIDNTADGFLALDSNTTGNTNIALGYLAGINITNSNNIDIGNQGVSTDNNIIRIGSGQTQTFIAGVINGNGGGLTNLNAAGLTGSASNITLTGNLNLPATTAGAGAIYSGGSTLILSDGNFNFFAGYQAGNLPPMMSGGFNTGVGYQALANDTSGQYNTAIGSFALWGNNANGNTAIGYSALEDNASGVYNTANGFRALFLNTSGYQNTANGVGALGSNTNGGNNTAIGYNALANNTSGGNNIALGNAAGINITIGNDNIDIGNSGVASDNNIIRIGTPGMHTNTYLAGTVTVPVLQITGGSDVAEPFVISTKNIPRGAVVVIDDKNPGYLKMSDRACDKRVAGIVSGANGINPGLTLRQQGVTEGGENVALSGRVYALADASNGPIKPGDLLTTSATAGHCMKVVNQVEAQGAIIGKAMTPLESGRGFVLVLVTLQ
jgi:hypothetical protein